MLLTLIMDEGITVYFVHACLTSINMLTNLKFRFRFKFSKINFLGVLFVLAKTIANATKEINFSGDDK